MNGEGIRLRLSDGRAFTESELLELVNAAQGVTACVSKGARRPTTASHYVDTLRLDRLVAALKER
jgi:hypothetical protein